MLRKLCLAALIVLALPFASAQAGVRIGIGIGVPIFAPWALTASYPESYQPYVLNDGSLANGAFALRDTYSSLSKALPQISYYAGSTKLKVFMSRSPGQRFSQTEDINGFNVSVTGVDNGQAIVIHPAGHNFLLVGYRSNVSFHDAIFRWPGVKEVRVERVYWAGDHWVRDGEPAYGLNQSSNTLDVELDNPQAVRVSW